MGDWKHKYLTSSPMYICNELESFWRCYQKGLISRSLKPVFWSPSSCTALAEAELEYNPNHKSTSVYVQFPLECFPEDWKSVLGNKKLSLLIWTTTPWTLPANQAVAYSGKSKYCLVHKISSQHVWIVAQELISEVNEKLKSNLEVLRSFDGDVLGQCQYQHPFTESRLLPLLNGGHVTMSKGTGLVHTAPNHGSDDFKLAAKYKIPNEECLVDENGCYIQSAPKDLQSLDVLGQGTNSVLKLLGDNLVLAEEYMHSYPYDWRTKKPVIVRASNQWFFDVESIKEKAMNCLESVNFYPPNAKISMKKTLESCPQWCISRQRVWGVPIPVLFKGIDGTPLINQDLINRVCNLVKETGGANFWWSHGIEEIIPQDFLKKNGIASTTELEKGADILDIWFDSGTSWYSSSLPKNPADLYLEGIDQFRGWFQSSLLTSVALNSEPPYKSVYVHGFALDQAGLKMSKSLGNVIDPFTITNGSQEGKNKIPALGIDTLRWWVAYYGSSNENVEILQTLLKESHSNVNKLRNTFRFILGNLNGFDYDEDEIKIENMLLVDKYMLHYLNDFQTKVENAYLALKFGVVCYHVLHLFVNRLSSFYFPAIKDRLYCNYEKSPLRRSCQSVLHHILEVSLRSLAPILPHLAEEVRLNHPNINYNKHSIFKRKTSIIESSQWENKELEKLIKTVEIIKYTLEKQNIKNTKDFDIVLVGEPEKIRPIKLLEKMNQHGNSELNHILQTASVEIGSSDDDCLAQMEFDHSFDISDLSLKVYFSKSKKSVCLRCRLRNVFNSLNRECLCDRCINALKQMQ